jgi:hypothetical protein
MITEHRNRNPKPPASPAGAPGRFRGNARRPAYRRRHSGEAERPRIMAAAHRTASCAPRYRRTGLGSGRRVPHPGPAPGLAPPYRARRCRCRTAAARRRSGRPSRAGRRGRRCAGARCRYCLTPRHVNVLVGSGVSLTEQDSGYIIARQATPRTIWL